MAFEDKSPAIQEVMRHLAPHGIQHRKCAWCGSTKTGPEDFVDDLSRREYTISRMCQVCQDRTFCDPEGQ